MYTKQSFLWFESGILFGLPLFLLIQYPTILDYRHHIMALGLLYVAYVMYRNKLNWHKLGFSRESLANYPWKKHLLAYTVLCLFIWQFTSRFPVSASKEGFSLSYATRWPPSILLVSYVFYSAPIQEFLFRGYLISRLRLVSNSPRFLIFYSGIVFSLLHVPFGNAWMVAGTLFLGIWCAYLFNRYQTLLAPIMAHAIFGSVYLAKAFGL